jgi:hypothetical protein
MSLTRGCGAGMRRKARRRAGRVCDWKPNPRCPTKGFDRFLKIRVVQKLQFLNNNRLKQQNAEHFARLVRQPTGLLNKPIRLLEIPLSLCYIFFIT